MIRSRTPTEAGTIIGGLVSASIFSAQAPDDGGEPECTAHDMDGSGDVDLRDFAAFQKAFTGSTP